MRILTILLLPLFFVAAPRLVQGQCDPDITDPVLQCHLQINFSLPAFGPGEVWPQDFIETVWDFCDADNLNYSLAILGEPQMSSLLLDCDDIGMHDILVEVSDQSGNVASCQSVLQVADLAPPIMVCNAVVSFPLNDPGPTILTPGDILEGAPLDNCTGVTYTLAPFGETPAPEWVLSCPDVGEYVVVVTGTDDYGNENSCWSEVSILGNADACDEVQVSGTLFYDEDEDCQLGAAEEGFDIIEVLITNLQSGQTHTVLADPNGFYATTLWFEPGAGDAALTVEPQGLPDFMVPCGASYTHSDLVNGSTIVQDLPVLLTNDCPYLQVDLATNALRPCMESTYTINYCNYSALLVPDAYLELEVDPLLTVVGSSIPWSTVNGNMYTFELGDLEGSSCGSFTVSVEVDCEVSLGQTLCNTATIYPAVLCGPVDDDYTGASLWAESRCEGDQVIFRITNVGNAAMAQAQEYIVVEDVIMYMNVPVDLEPGEEIEIELPANGSTWRLEGPNEYLYPGIYEPIAWSEGCGGINMTGLVNLFPVDINDPFRSVFCLEVTGSYDPNDKTGFPLGVEEDHFIRANQSLDYLVRFQNTGTDTAFAVAILDTLDAMLEWGSVRPGASSHPYEFESLGNGVIRFSFPGIQLPDSTTNLEGSRGFVQFQIDQKPDLPAGTILQNRAAIYFDFNEPVITNETWHTIGEPIFNGLQLVPDQRGVFSVFPSPARDQLNLRLETDWRGPLDILIINMQGQMVQQLSAEKRSDNWSGSLDVSSLAPGAYILLVTDGTRMMRQKVMVQ